MDSSELADLIAKAISEQDLILFVDALDECKDPRRTARLLESITSQLEVIGDHPRITKDGDGRGLSDGMDGVGNWERDFVPGIPEMYLSTRPEKLNSIPEPARREAKFCKLTYTYSEISESLPGGS